jgi:predicted RNA-binding protein with PIN domain
MVTLVLDGYNVIHAVPELARRLDQSLEAAREALIEFCQAYRAKRGDVAQLCIVFDGDDAYAGPGPARAGVAVLFTRRGEEADERILSLIRADGGRSRFLIVSNDTYVLNNARAHGARVISVSEFCAQVQPAAPSRLKRPDVVDKASLSTSEAHRITEEYRKLLEKESA